ncbi:MAG: CbiX/SirB N-terminal domain-containing protein [Gemmatimonadota bacterium]
MDPLTAGVLLVGHGSELSADSSSPVRELARRLRGAHAAGEVHVAFWKEEPYLHHALDLFESRDVFVVPLFTSEGYFTEGVLPRELGMDPPCLRPWMCVRRCPPVGTHPAMADLVLARAREAVRLSTGAERDAALVVLGHGTETHPGSGATTRAVVEALRRRAIYRDVVSAFLDQSPGIAGVLGGLDAPDRIVVPFFIGEGWHVGTTIPEELGLGETRTTLGEATVWYSKPVGTHPGILEVVRAIFSEAVAGVGEAYTRAGLGPADPPARVARETFLQGLRGGGAGPRTFLQVGITASDDDRFELRHREDLHRPSPELATYADANAAEGLGGRTAAGEHRPLRTAPGLARGWRIAGLDGEGVWEALGQLYPGAAIHRELAGRGELAVTPFWETATRQTGIYAGLEGLPEGEIETAVRDRCGDRCLRTPFWEPASAYVRPERAGSVPCPEACPALLSRVRKGRPAASSEG